MKSERILTLHPQGKKGVNIRKEKYDRFRESIIDILKTNEKMSRKELLQEVTLKVEDDFEGSVSWYFTTVKLDLQARGEIKVEKVNGLQYVKCH